MQSVTIVFDLDGTLINTAPDLLDALAIFLDEAGLPPVDMSRAKDLIGHGIRPMIEKALRDHGDLVTPQVLDTAWQRYLALYTPRMNHLSHPFEGVEEALEALAAGGYRLAICTNKLEHLAKQAIDGCGWSHRFAALAGNETFPWKKPDGRHILSVVEAAGGHGGRTIMVGDSRADIEAARSAGVPVIGYKGGYTDVPLEELQPDVILHDYRDLSGLIDGILAKP